MTKRSYWAWAAVLTSVSCMGTGQEPPDNPDNPNSPPVPTCELAAAPPAMPRLTRAEYANAIRDLFGVAVGPEQLLLEDEALGGFTANTTAVVQTLHVERYAEAAATVAERADVAALTTDCVQRDAECLRTFAAQMGRRAFRRPLTNEETAAFDTLIGAGSDFDATVRTMIETIVQTPSFLYRAELGQPSDARSTALTGYELASRLSFLLWRSIPDDELLAAADSGALNSADELITQANRMMASPKFTGALDDFHGQWLKLDKLAITPKAEEFPDWDQLRDAARQEALLTTRALVRGDKGLGHYFASERPTGIVNPTLADLYGVTPAGDDFAPVDLDPATRSGGLLTQAAFLALNAKATTTSPVHRGIFVRRSVLCGVLFPPPPNVDTSLPDPPPTVTMREQLAAHREDPACRGCHELTDPIGLTFEHYDAIGRYRTTEAGRPVDASGYIAQSESSDAQFMNAVELSRHLAQSSEVAQCLSKKWFAFAFGRSPTDSEACSLKASVSPATTVRSLLVNFITSDAFRQIRVDR